MFYPLKQSLEQRSDQEVPRTIGQHPVLWEQEGVPEGMVPLFRQMQQLIGHCSGQVDLVVQVEHRSQTGS